MSTNTSPGRPPPGIVPGFRTSPLVPPAAKNRQFPAFCPTSGIPTLDAHFDNLAPRVGTTRCHVTRPHTSRIPTPGAHFDILLPRVGTTRGHFAHPPYVTYPDTGCRVPISPTSGTNHPKLVFNSPIPDVSPPPSHASKSSDLGDEIIREHFDAPIPDVSRSPDATRRDFRPRIPTHATEHPISPTSGIPTTKPSIRFLRSSVSLRRNRAPDLPDLRYCITQPSKRFLRPRVSMSETRRPLATTSSTDSSKKRAPKMLGGAIASDRPTAQNDPTHIDPCSTHHRTRQADPAGRPL